MAKYRVYDTDGSFIDVTANGPMEASKIARDKGYTVSNVSLQEGDTQEKKGEERY